MGKTGKLIEKNHLPIGDGKQYQVRYSVHENDNGFCVVGLAVDHLGQSIDKTKRTAKSPGHSLELKERLITQVRNRVIAALDRKLGKKQGSSKKGTRTAEVGSDVYSRTYAQLIKSQAPINTNWSPDTRGNALRYFEGHILPFLQKNANMDLLPSDIEEFRQKLLTEIGSNSRSSSIVRKNLQTLRHHLMDADCIYQEMRRIDPTLDHITFAQSAAKHIQRETIKSLPRHVRRRFEQVIKDCIETEPEMVIGTVLMYDAGLRTAEAAAAIYGVDITDTHLAKVCVCWQEKDGLRSPILKTSNSYRTVPLSFWGISVIRRCMEHTAAPADPNKAPRLKRNLSAWIRDKLTACGMSDQDWAAVSQEEQLHPDCDSEGKIIYDICAYILRRDRCSRWRNICGITQLEIDYLLGHKIKIPQAKREDMRTEAAIRKMVPKLERYIYDPDISRNPRCRPVSLVHGTDVDVIPYETVRMTNDSQAELLIDLTIDAELTNELIALILPPNAKTLEVHPIQSKQLDARSNVPIIGTGGIL